MQASTLCCTCCSAHLLVPASAAMKTLHLYRNILKHIKVFPSIKRDRLVAEVRYGEGPCIA